MVISVSSSTRLILVNKKPLPMIWIVLRMKCRKNWKTSELDTRFKLLIVFIIMCASKYTRILNICILILFVAKKWL